MKLLESPAKKQWEKIGIQPHHGIALPLFSLHSNQSCGVGEFTDLIPMFKWCNQIGYDVIQLLPLNDTGNDTSPYSAISAFALNPIHLGLWHLPYVDQYPDLQVKLRELNPLCESQRCDYPKVQAEKTAFLQKYYQYTKAQIVSQAEYQEFVSKNSWLPGYALFKALKEKFDWCSWSTWESSYQNISENRFRELQIEYEEQISFHVFIQFLCFKQFIDVKKLANENRILLIGDIPILINRESADVWLYPQLFQMQYSAGAPPDMYAADGQNWGFPIYNWTAIEKNNYRWWKDRLIAASPLYDIYRIDHIVGFYRIWAIPEKLAGRFGQFIPSDNWVPHGEKILRMMLETSKMLPIGEDLGSIPPEVRASMLNLGICGTKVMRWERVWNEDRRFIKPQDYIPESMTTVSTHDSEPLFLWWQENSEEAKDFAQFKGWEYKTPLTKEHATEILRDSHHTASLYHINPLQEYLALIDGYTWPSPNDERVNVPGTISSRNWSYRFRPNVEEIVSNPALTTLMKNLIT